MELNNESTTVLVVDDDFLIRFSYVDMLEDTAKDIIETDDGASAIEILKANPEIDLVISDCNMKEMDGDELIQHMRQAGDMRPFIMISGESGERRQTAAGILMNSGNAVFLSKPTTKQEILNAAAQLVSEHEYGCDMPSSNIA